jgi:hypothetical protein
LSITDGVEATTLALAATASTGYHLLSYSPSMSNYSDQRNASLYMPGDYSVVGKYSNIVETITCEIVGTSRDDLFVKLRALYRAIENARDWVQYPNQRNPSYLSYKPDSTSNTSYSCILGGRVDIPGTDSSIMQGAGGEGEQLANTMTGIVITIEREPFWRSAIPNLWLTGATVLINSVLTPNPWYSHNLGTILGDFPAPFNCVFWDIIPASTDKLWIGYASLARKGAGYSGAGMREVEGGTMGTDTTAVADTTASPGGATNNKARCTFATVATDAERVTITVTPGAGVFRVFARCMLSAAGTVSLYVKAKSSVSGSGTSIAKISNSPVAITHTAWRMIDLGLVVLPNVDQISFQPANDDRALIVSALRSAGACSLDIDFLFLLPVDEAVVQVTGALLATAADAVVYSSMMPKQNVLYASDNQNSPTRFPQWSGYIRPLPGAGYLYVLGGDVNFANTFTLAGNNFQFGAYCNYAYLSARGNG